MDLLQQIKSDKESGASELKKFAKRAILEFISRPYLKEELFNFLNQLFSIRPSMAPIKVMVDLIISEIKDLQEPKLINEKIKEILSTEINFKTLIKNVTRVLKDKKIILTYSYSSTVFEVLCKFSVLSVFVPESRPNFEGRKLALKLQSASGEEGLKVIFITDAEVSKFIKDVDIVLLGADRVTEDSVINKVGTFGIALLAREFEIPCYVICGMDKFLSNKDTPFKEASKEPNEIWDKEGIQILNFYFEAIPLEYFTGIITDKKIFLPQDVLSYF